MPFEPFDPAGDVTISRRNLPHWEQSGATYFITFRTADSMSAAAYQLWLRARNDWLRWHGLNPNDDDWKSRLNMLDAKLQFQFRAMNLLEFDKHLDRGHGLCVLRRSQIAEKVEESLMHFDGDRYQLGDFVVMPNHVHLLVQMLPPIEMLDQCYSWKKFTAREINRALGQRGHFWQDESFDHLVRNLDQFEYYRRYIADNAKKAGLREGEYLYRRLIDR